MNTRKANLKKLRLANSGSSDSRNGRRKAAPTISSFFPNEDNTADLPNDVDMNKHSETMPSPIEKQDEELVVKSKRATRTKLSTFLPKETRMKPAVEKPISDFLTKGKMDDFETPEKNIKKAPKAKAKPRPKRQQKIKTAFLKNEELFSEVTAQHCLVDNINPDEMQMALALSRSEADVSGVIVVDDEVKEKKEGIGDKLKKFGFRIAQSEDYNLTAFLPTNKRTKWANKFTALTLRNPKKQLERMNQKVEEFLSKQFILSDSMCDDETMKYSVKSKILLPLVAEDCLILQSDARERVRVVDFYVLSLFEPSRTKVGYLLKDVRCIAGRDISPLKKKSPKVENVELDPLLQSPAMKKSRYDEILFHDVLSLPYQNTKVDSSLDQPLQPLPATIGTFPNYNSATATNGSFCAIVSDYPNSPVIPNDSDSIASSIELSSSVSNGAIIPTESRQILGCTVPISILNDATSNVSNESSIRPVSEITPKPQMNSGSCLYSQLQLSSIRPTSPDIFADSDVEMETDNCSEMAKLNVSESSSGGHHITTYELFSSDEVKTVININSNSNDVNHNSLPALIDLTQCGSEPNSQHSDKNVSPIIVQSYQDKCPAEDLSTTSSIIATQFDEQPSTSFNCWSHSNGSFSLENSTESKPSGFSFRSSASEDLHKSISFTKSTSMKTDDSIDLTQNSDGESDCLLLSDDEVNYSIWKADKSLHDKEEEDFAIQNVTIDHLLSEGEKIDSDEKHEFSFVDLVALTQPLASQSEEFDVNLKTMSNSSGLDLLDLDLSKPSDFGILEEQSPFKTPTKTPKKTPRKTPSSASSKCRRVLSASFLASPAESSAPLKRFSSMTTNKFNEFTKSDEDNLSDLDEIDKLIYGSPSKRAYKKPAGLDQLLTGTISAKINLPAKTEPEQPKEFEFNGRTYLVQTTNILERPNYETMDESAVLNQLYKYGIKPLKRKQALKILEYIYNQTHPCLIDEEDIPSQTVTSNDDDKNSSDEDGNQETMTAVNASKFNFKDCWGHILVTNVDISMEIEEEQYILQTNVSKKISAALLPFHIAWYNLVKSNKLLHEAILHYEPIDLQDVYLFFKGLGYRYDPKELKYFFDSRSIIFRYDLNPSAGSNRHVRKKGLKLTQRYRKNKIS